MKPALMTTTTILGCVLAAALASAQSPSIIQNTRTTMNGVSANATAASNEALGIHESVPSAASVTHTPAKSGGVAVIAPAKSSARVAISAGTKTTGPKTVGAKTANSSGAKKVTVRHSAHPKTTVATTAAPAAAKTSAPPEANVGGAAGSVEGESAANGQPALDSKYNANGRRDPFISPVVSRASGGSGCSTGKKCLEIGAISLRGVVHQESGFIAVVSNGLNKAYFLRENDPVFNGYVMKITGDSIVFQETLQDRLGKSFTREVVKKITTPAV
jgi:hypothetical protein